MVMPLLTVYCVPGNTIKSVQGDASDCNAETPCDGVSNEGNAEHTACGK